MYMYSNNTVGSVIESCLTMWCLHDKAIPMMRPKHSGIVAIVIVDIAQESDMLSYYQIS